MRELIKDRQAFARIGRLYGIKRRWFGLEPAPWYRARLIGAVECKW